MFECCHYCVVRHLGCHDKCPEYLSEVAKNEAKKEWNKIHNQPSISQGSFIGNAINSHKRKK